MQAYIQNSLSPQQTEELFLRLNSHPQLSEKLLKELAESYEDKMSNPVPLKEDISQRMLQGLLTKINEAPVISMKQSNAGNWKRWIAAAAVFIIVGSIAYFITDRQPKTAIKQSAVNSQHVEKDVLPGFDGAILTTAGNNQIILDGAANGIVNKEGNTDVIKRDNQLVYKESSAAIPDIETFNTFSTLKGRKFQLILSDGTKVWLDAASSITYPIAFTGTQRKVKTTGQVYFEVAKDPAKPFIVDIGATSIEVLGTHFNVNAYEDENTIKTTLLEGMIKITRNNRSSLLKPGQQAVTGGSATESIKVNNAVDLDAVMAWKNGLFQFTGADLTSVLRQLSRWYDVDIVYEGKIPRREFEGKIGRDLNLSQVLKVLEKVQVRFRIEGTKLIVQP